MIDPAKDYYCVYFTFSACRFEISVNDIPVLRYDDGGSVSTRMFINQFVDSGKNKLKIVMLPQDESGFKLTTMCNISVVHTLGDVERELAQLSFAFDDTNPLPVVSLDKEFVIASLPFKASPWSAIEPHVMTDLEREQLNRGFRRLMSLFTRKDINEIMSAGRSKDDFYIDRYYYPAQERRSYIRNFFSEKFSDSDWQSSTYFENHYKLKEYANSRLYSFELPNSKSPIELHNPVSKIRINVPVFFVYQQGDYDWIL